MRLLRTMLRVDEAGHECFETQLQRILRVFAHRRDRASGKLEK